jgi:hypothetical protein
VICIGAVQTIFVSKNLCDEGRKVYQRAVDHFRTGNTSKIMKNTYEPLCAMIYPANLKILSETSEGSEVELAIHLLRRGS